MNSTMRGVLRGAAIAVGGGFVIGVTASVLGVSPANATPSNYVMTDPSGVAATCATVAEGFTGNIAHDTTVALGVAQGISHYYGVSMTDAIQAENYQVETYCPQYWPNLVAAGAYARANDHSGTEV